MEEEQNEFASVRFRYETTIVCVKVAHSLSSCLAFIRNGM